MRRALLFAFVLLAIVAAPARAAGPYWGFSASRRWRVFGRGSVGVFLGIGVNYKTETDQLNSTLKALHHVKRVLLMTVFVPRDWQDPNNDTIRSVGKRFSNVALSPACTTRMCGSSVLTFLGKVRTAT